ncbi:hypothetical protein GCM10010252_08950 [Streptomyces aureoverticillatus]|nr:hypothetical protein GCM10010252_08950 [Streptomyces aureoverticillatus]
MPINRVAKHPRASGIVYVVATDHREQRFRAATPAVWLSLPRFESWRRHMKETLSVLRKRKRRGSFRFATPSTAWDLPGTGPALAWHRSATVTSAPPRHCHGTGPAP